MRQVKYGYRKELRGVGMEEAYRRAVEALKTEGFGILSEIDVQATMKAKLGIDWPGYKILGACNPQLARRALSAEPEIGLLLPCNVIVYETDDRKTVVSAVDPLQTLAAQSDPSIRPLAEQVQQKLKRALDAI